MARASFALLGWLCATTLCPLPLSAQADRASQVIDENIRIRLPIVPCEAPSATLEIARALRVPAGVESVPEACPGPQHPLPSVTDELSLAGMRGSDALDAIVRSDPRYYWLVTDGVIVMRPITAWQDPKHFLHQSIAGFTLTDENMHGAMRALAAASATWSATGTSRTGAATPLGARTFSVALGPTSLFEALNAVGRAHGELLWSVFYCRPPRQEGATINLITLDGSGVEWWAAGIRSPEARCSSLGNIGALRWGCSRRHV